MILKIIFVITNNSDLIYLVKNIYMCMFADIKRKKTKLRKSIFFYIFKFVFAINMA